MALGQWAMMTHKFVKFIIKSCHKFIVSDNDQPTVFSCVLLVDCATIIIIMIIK